jgi:hypothetical protein
MVNRWWKEDISLRHTRQHCIDQYGTNFVEEDLPSLLRMDGLQEEDIHRLTDYGPDMEPPPPRWKVEAKPVPECGQSAIDGRESDSGSEMSEGWENVDED